MGIERIALLMEQKDDSNRLTQDTDCFIAALGQEASQPCAQLTHQLRLRGIKAAMDYSGRRLKAQMKQANRVHARFVLIVGEDELEQQKAGGS